MPYARKDQTRYIQQSPLSKKKGLDIHMSFESKMRKFRRRVQRSGVLQEAKDRMHYTKPTTRRRNALNAAKRREYQRRMNDTLISRKNRLY